MESPRSTYPSKLKDINSLLHELAASRDGAIFPVVIAIVREGIVHSVPAISGVIDECAESFLHLFGIEVWGPVAVGERIGSELADVVFIT